MSPSGLKWSEPVEDTPLELGILRIESELITLDLSTPCLSDPMSPFGKFQLRRDQTGRKLGKWLSTNSPSAWLIRGATALNITAQSGVLC
ncbi:hypothetical protein MAR_003877 [Mya arenaria]|uniref:Uncharacterized protein n=1 Tax=Mya arenaria TaxID=6604 RepID=A0ABY7EWZ0_MYAAR|nr:hypothetical protein MAR_003877 [Mya arenaria]